MFILQPPIIQAGQPAQTFNPQSASNNTFNPVPDIPQSSTYGQGDVFIPDPNKTPTETQIDILQQKAFNEIDRIMSQPLTTSGKTKIEQQVDEASRQAFGIVSGEESQIHGIEDNDKSSESSGTMRKVAAAGTTTTQLNLKAAKFVKNTRDITGASQIGRFQRILHPIENHTAIKTTTKAALEAKKITQGALAGSKALSLVSKANYVLAPIAGWSAVSDCWSDIEEAAYFDDYAKLDGKLSEEEINDLQREKAWCATANTAFTTVGAGVGLWKGMVAGAAIGTAVGGPIGTIVGGILGACAGAGIGSLVGNVAKSFIARDGIGRRIFKTLFGFRKTSKELYQEKLKEIEKAKKEQEANKAQNQNPPGMVPTPATAFPISA